MAGYCNHKNWFFGLSGVPCSNPATVPTPRGAKCPEHADLYLSGTGDSGAQHLGEGVQPAPTPFPDSTSERAA